VSITDIEKQTINKKCMVYYHFLIIPYTNKHIKQ